MLNLYSTLIQSFDFIISNKQDIVESYKNFLFQIRCYDGNYKYNDENDYKNHIQHVTTFDVHNFVGVISDLQ